MTWLRVEPFIRNLEIEEKNRFFMKFDKFSFGPVNPHLPVGYSKLRATDELRLREAENVLWD